MKILSEAEVRRLVSPKECIEAMRQALTSLAEGKSEMPLRTIHHLPNGAAFGFMPAYAGDCFGAKVLTAYAPNAGTKYPSHIGYVMLFESEHCTVTGLVDATAVTEIRTGAVSALATDMLARKDASTLCLIGAGAQARSHMAAISTVRAVRQVTVFDMRPEAAQRFADETRKQYGIPVQVCASAREATQDADIICTLTPAKEAYLTLDMVKPGAHVNAVGTFSPTTREAASDLIAKCRLYADQVSAAKRESGEYLIPLSEGLIDQNHFIGDLGDVLTGRAPGRQNQTEITLFDALGLAIEDIACASLALKKANAS